MILAFNLGLALKILIGAMTNDLMVAYMQRRCQDSPSDTPNYATSNILHTC